MASKVYFEEGRYRVTGRVFRARAKTFLIKYIEKTQLRRPALVFSLAITLASAGLWWSFRDVIYDHELPYFFVPQILATLITSRIAMLVVVSKALGPEIAVVGLYGRLTRMRLAIDRALEDRMESLERGAPEPGEEEWRQEEPHL